MKKLLSAALAGAMVLSISAAPTIATAESRWDRPHQSNNNNQWVWRHRDRDRDHRHWAYRDHDDDNDAIIAGVAGFAAGALVGSLAASSGSSHVDRCRAQYQSYDIGSDTYLGYDGYRHQCVL